MAALCALKISNTATRHTPAAAARATSTARLPAISRADNTPIMANITIEATPRIRSMNTEATAS